MADRDRLALTLTREQARFVGLYIASVEGAASVDIYDLGRGDCQLVVFDKTGERTATETMRGHDPMIAMLSATLPPGSRSWRALTHERGPREIALARFAFG